MAFVRRFKPGEQGVACVLLGDPVKVKVHWVDGQGLPCRGAGCEHCRDPEHSLTKCKFYFPAWTKINDWNTGTLHFGPAVVELTQANILEIERIPYPVVVLLSRADSKRSVLTLKVTRMEALLPQDRPPRDCFVDVRQALRRWDGWKDFDKPLLRVVV